MSVTSLRIFTDELSYSLKNGSKRCVIERFDALLAYLLIVEVHKLCAIAAEDASRLIFFENNTILLYEYLHAVAGRDIKLFSCLNGEHYSSKLVNFSYNS